MRRHEKPAWKRCKRYNYVGHCMLSYQEPAIRAPNASLRPQFCLFITVHRTPIRSHTGPDSEILIYTKYRDTTRKPYQMPSHNKHHNAPETDQERRFRLFPCRHLLARLPLFIRLHIVIFCRSLPRRLLPKSLQRHTLTVRRRWCGEVSGSMLLSATSSYM